MSCALLVAYLESTNDPPFSAVFDMLVTIIAITYNIRDETRVFSESLHPQACCIVLDIQISFTKHLLKNSMME